MRSARRFAWPGPTRLLAVIAALVFIAGVAACPLAQGLPPGVSGADRQSIEGVIARQLDAFRHDDAAGAYAFAAPSIQRMFPTPDIFMDMVRRGYAPVYRPSDVVFADLALRDGDLVQTVELTGPDGRPVTALYTMERQPDGSWRIAGCMLVPSARIGA